MYLFMGFGLVLSYLLDTASPWLLWLQAPVVSDVALAVAIVCLLAVLRENRYGRLCHDLFSSAVLLVWYPHWQPLLVPDTPVFFAYSLYFVFCAAFIELFFLSQRHNVEKAVLAQIQLFTRRLSVKSWMLMLLVLASLEMPEHFLLYPVAMTLLMLRYALSTYLEVDLVKKQPRIG